MLSKGEVFILSAPSGTGKTTLIKRMFSRYETLNSTLAFAVSHTTRPPRPGEVDGSDYYFVDQPEFERLVAAQGFLEWAVVHGRLYGTSRTEIARLLDRGVDVLLDIDVQGAQEVWRQEKPKPCSIFILPPSFEDLERRLQGRRSEPPEQIRTRLENARKEVMAYAGYDYVILNDDLDRACEALASIFLARRHHQNRMKHQVEQILCHFRSPDP